MTKRTEPNNPEKTLKLTASREGFLNKDIEDGGPEVSLGGRPRAFINWDKVETCMAMGGDLSMCAAHGGVSVATLERRIMERYEGALFREVRQYFMTDVKALALRQLRNLVAKGNVRATIFMNKAWNNMNDRPKDMGNEDEDGDAGTFKLAYDPHEPPPIDATYTPIGDDE